MLTSYEERGPIRLGKIPVFPRGPRRVLDACPLCGHARGISLATWEKQCAAARADLLKTLDDNEISMKKLKDRMKVLADLSDRDGVATYARSFHDSGIHTPESLLFVARACDGFLLHPESAALYQLALEDSPTDVMLREKLARSLMNQGITDGVEDLLRHIVERLEVEKVGMFHDLARLFAANGDREQALWVLDVSESVDPDLARKRDYKELRTAIERNGTPPQPTALPALMTATSATPARLPRPKMRPEVIIAVAAVPTLIGLVVGGYALLSMGMANNRTVYLVNGLSGAYQVSVNGAQSMNIQPGAAVETKVREGIVRLSVQSNQYDLGDMTVSIRSDFWTRPIHYKRVFVINPDATALILESDVVYINQDAKSRRTPPNPTHTVHTGERVYQFNRVDYPFTVSPDTLPMHGATSHLTRKELGITEATAAWFHINMIAGGLDVRTRQGLGEFLRNRLRLEPGRLDEARQLVNLLEPRDIRRAMDAQLSARPINTSIHRIWQDTAFTVGSTDLLSEYEAILSADPDNTAAMYLLARVETNFERVGSLLQRATEGPQPASEAWHTLAAWNMTMGRFTQAAQLARRAREAANPHPEAYDVFVEAALALGQWKAAEEVLRRHLDAPGQYTRNIRRLVYTLAMAGEAEQALEQARRFYNTNSSLVGESSWEFTERMEGVIEEARNPNRIWDGHISDYEYGHVAALLFHDRVSDAVQTADEEGTTTIDNALLYVTLKGTSRENLGEGFLREIIDTFDARGGRDYRLAAAILDGKPGTNPRDILLLTLENEDKIAALFVTAVRHPELKDACVNLIGALNYKRFFPHAVVEKYRARL